MDRSQLRRRAIVLGASGLGLLALNAPVAAVDYFRLGAGGDFRAPQLWSPWNPLNPGQFQGPGGVNDTANFNLGVTPANRYTVTNVFGQNQQLRIHNDAVALVLSNDYTLGQNDNAFGLRVGTVAGGTGDVLISGSGVFRPGSTFIGTEAGSTGHVTLDGVAWDGSGSIANVIGHFGTGSLTIQNGGTVVIPQSALIGLNSGAAGAVTVTGSGSSWTHNSVWVGANGTGSLTISGGGSVETATVATVAPWPGSGSVMVSGAGSSWTIEEELRVGGMGSGWLEIENGGSVSNAGARIGIDEASSGVVVVAGHGTSWTSSGIVRVGEGGHGALSISAGASVSNTLGIIGDASGSTGTTWVTGGGSTWTMSGAIWVGNHGVGTLYIDDGGTLAANNANIGLHSSGTATVRGPGSSLALAVELFVGGGGGDGILTIENGGHVSSLRGGIGYFSDSIGHVVLDGEGSTWINSGNPEAINSGDMFIGVLGTGLLEIKGGTMFNGSRPASVLWIGSGGRVDLTGGDLDARGSIEVAGGPFNFVGGRLHVDTFNGNLLNEGGVFAPGHISPRIGQSLVVGNYTQQSAGALEIEIGGLSAGRHDRLVVERTATLAGRIELLLVDGFVPAYGDAVQVVQTQVADVVGIFDTVGGSLPLPGLGLAVIYSTNDVRVVAAIPGDANLDGVVNIADLGILAGNWQQSGATWKDGNFTGSGMVNIADLGVLAGHWQQGAGGMGMSFEAALGMFDAFDGVVVPEAGMAGALSLVGMVVLRRRRWSGG